MNGDQIAALVMAVLLVGHLVLMFYNFAAACLLPAFLLVGYMLVCLALGVPA